MDVVIGGNWIGIWCGRGMEVFVGCLAIVLQRTRADPLSRDVFVKDESSTISGLSK